MGGWEGGKEGRREEHQIMLTNYKLTPHNSQLHVLT